MREKKRNVQNSDKGVLYIRYDKNTFAGKVIEEFKEKSPGFTLNRRLLNLIFLIEVIDFSNNVNINLSDLNNAYYESLKFLTEKKERASSQIEEITRQIVSKDKTQFATKSTLIEQTLTNKNKLTDNKVSTIVR